MTWSTSSSTSLGDGLKLSAPFLGGGFLGGLGGEEGPLKDVRARIQAKVAEARTRMEEMRTRFTGGTTTTPQMLAQMPRLSKIRGRIGSFGLGLGIKDRYKTQKSREPGHHMQEISPTAQEAAIADDIYSERLRAESSPGLSVSL